MQTKLLLAGIVLFAIAGYGVYQYSTPVPEVEIKSTVQTTDECPGQQYRTTASFNGMMDLINAESFSTAKIQVIEQETPKDPKVFSYEQFLSLIQTVSMTSDKVKVVNIVNKFIPYLTTENAISILNELGFSSDQLEILEVLADTLIDADEANKNKIINIFGFSSDQNKAREILENARSRNCIFGTVDENVATFIIDISPSMEATFTSSNGQTYRRIDFVKQNIKETISEQLRGYQKFNVIALHQYADQWKSTNVAVTADNISSALSWIDGLSTKSYTNLSYPLSKAFETTEQLEAVYLLTDGQPTYGIQTVSGMQSHVQGLIDSRSPKVKIHCISFMLGGSESASDRLQAQQYLETIAHTSGGSLKSFQ